jgi:hypothetical protein
MLAGWRKFVLDLESVKIIFPAVRGDYRGHLLAASTSAASGKNFQWKSFSFALLSRRRRRRYRE